jgi:uncharacterized protein
MKTDWKALPDLGVGLGFRSPFKSELFLKPQTVDFLEITADHYIDASKQKMRELDILLDHFVLIPHAINLSLGNADGLDERYLEKLARLIQKINPPYWSEHIAFTQGGETEVGHLSSLPFHSEVADIFVANVLKTKEFINKPLVLENITYIVEIPNADLSEGAFVRRILEKADCGLLLDITNMYINSYNHQFDYQLFLQEIPLERLVQFHFTGGFVNPENGWYIDSHSRATPPEIWDTMEKTLAFAKPKGIILERDDNIPPLAELEKELARARSLWQKA